MRVFAISDLHADYPENRRWLDHLSRQDFQQDVLIVAGDISDELGLLEEVLGHFNRLFDAVLFVPGNHELWVRDGAGDCSLKKLELVNERCRSVGVHTGLYERQGISFVPLLSWYDHSFATPDAYLRRAWRDYKACRWPAELPDSEAINRFFLRQNEALLQTRNAVIISYSHFLPRIDLMPARIPVSKRRIYPVLGSTGLGGQVQRLQPNIHVYGHSHVNRAVTLDGVYYVNNAFGYPAEDRIARKRLFCVYDDKYVARAQPATGVLR